MDLKIDLYADLVCPWCYIGKRWLDAALQGLGEGLSVGITWRPFELNPDLPPGGIGRASYRAAKLGVGAEQLAAMDARIQAVAQAEDLPLDLARIERVPNTFNAHRLIWLARQEDVQNEMVDALFHGYFASGKDLGDRMVLAEIAADVGLNGDMVELFLDTAEGIMEVRAEESLGLGLGISAVPCLVVNGVHQILGARSPRVLRETLMSLIWSERRERALGEEVSPRSAGLDDMPGDQAGL